MKIHIRRKRLWSGNIRSETWFGSSEDSVPPQTLPSPGRAAWAASLALGVASAFGGGTFMGTGSCDSHISSGVAAGQTHSRCDTAGTRGCDCHPTHSAREALPVTLRTFLHLLMYNHNLVCLELLEINLWQDKNIYKILQV